MGITRKILQPFLGKKRFYGFWHKAYEISLIGMNIGNGGDFESSGETCAIQYIKENIVRMDKPVLFDVGANVGTYTQELLKHFKNASIHCFEPAKRTFEMLSVNVKSPNVILNNFGVSDKISESILYSNSEHSGLASLYNRQHFNHMNMSSEMVKLDTIDHYCEEREITHIHFLKIDIEGNELNAFNGAKKMLDSRNIDVIQIEFGGCNIDSRTYFRDFWNLLHDNYRIYRILRDGLKEVELYNDGLEIFFCTNYLIISKNIVK